MKKLVLEETWPESWKSTYVYDLEEVYHQYRHLGYAYAYQNRQKRTLEAVTRYAPAGGMILDVAGAQGNFSLLMAEMGYDVTWNDLRAEMIDYISLKHETGSLKYAPGNVFDLGFQEAFDLVLITEIIEHTAHPDEFLQKISDLVRPNGCIVMTTPNGGYFKNKLPKFSECADPSQFESIQFQPNSDGHIFLLHTDEIEPLANAASLKVEESCLFTNPLTNGHVKTAPLLKVLPKSLVDGVEKCTCALPKPLSHKLNVHMMVVFRKVD